MLEAVLFALFALAAVAGALWVILGRNATWSALGLLTNFVAVAALYILLNAPFVALVQIIVYAGAVVVLFLFVVMLLSVRRGEAPVSRHGLAYAGAVLAVAFLVLLGYLLTAGKLPSAALVAQDNVQAIGTALYSRYLLPVEMSAVLLLIGVIGAVVLAKKR
jgi:NADH-quinone oxidoreductase subunit J